MKFKINQQVVCVNPAGSLIGDKVYIILNMTCCPFCTAELIDVGCLVDTSVYSRCKRCKGKFPVNYRWYDSGRFAPLEYETVHEEILEKFKIPQEAPDVPEKIPQTPAKI